MSSRKAPRCRSCKHPMKGHNKLGLCMSASPEVLSREEEEAEQLQQQQQQQQQQHQQQAQAQTSASGNSYMSPPPTPPPSSSPAGPATGPIAGAAQAPSPLAPHAHQRPPLPRTYTPAIMSEPSFTIPESGYFHRRNPKFVHLLAPSPPPPPHQSRSAMHGHLHPAAAATREYHYATQEEIYEYRGEDAADEDDDEEYNGGPGAQTPTVIVGSDGETVEALSDRSGSASPGPPPPPPPGAAHYLSTATPSSSSFASSSSASFFGRAGYGRGKEERAVYKRVPSRPPVTSAALARHSRSPRPPPRPPAPQRHGSVLAGGLAYLGSFRWIRSPTPEDIRANSPAPSPAPSPSPAAAAAAGAKHRASKQRHHRARSHSHSHSNSQSSGHNGVGAPAGVAAAGGGETKIATRDVVVFGLILVVGGTLAMLLVVHLGLRSLRSVLESVGFGSVSRN